MIAIRSDHAEARIIHADCVEHMAALPPNSIDAIVTDPPYGLEFMGKAWDRLDTRQPGDANYTSVDNPYGQHRVRYSSSPSYGGTVGPQQTAWHRRWADQAIRVLKPGGHIAAFGGTRTVHRLAVALEDAGFEIRDMLAWIYGSGFPKSRNIATRDLDGADAERWAGWGTALKPAHEPIILARKLLKGTVARNLVERGTGAINIDACRISTGDNLNGGAYAESPTERGGGRSSLPGDSRTGASAGMFQPGSTAATGYVQPSGRWPANVILSHAADCGADACAPDCPLDGLGHTARYFYCAKASKREREAGCEGLAAAQQDTTRKPGDPGGDNPRNRGARKRRNHHPTVKPVALMRWLVRLLVPPGGVVLDPFGGSGTTGVAALLERRDCILIEREAPYVEIAAARIAHDFK